MKVPFLDVLGTQVPLRSALLNAMARVLDSGQFILGPEVESAEAALAQKLEVKHAVALSSGTDALLAALMALGVGPGDEVITTPFSFYATVGAIVRLGARPEFVDIDPRSLNLDAERVAAAITARTKAVIPVHLFGRPAPMPRVAVPIIEDAAQAIGATTVRGLASCLSFFPSKNLGVLGDGGALLTNDDGFADLVMLLRTHGGRPKYVHQVIGGNFRLDALQAAILQVKLPHLDAWTAARRANAERYRGLFRAARDLPADLHLPEHDAAHVYNQFVIRAPRRDLLRAHLARQEIGTEVYYPVPLHLQPCFRDFAYRAGTLPVAEAACSDVLALPIYPGLTEAQQAYVVDQIVTFYK